MMPMQIPSNSDIVYDLAWASLQSSCILAMNKRDFLTADAYLEWAAQWWDCHTRRTSTYEEAERKAIQCEYYSSCSLEQIKNDVMAKRKDAKMHRMVLTRHADNDIMKECNQ